MAPSSARQSPPTNLYENTSHPTRIAGIPWYIFVIIIAVILVTGLLKIYPDNMVGGFGAAIVFGGLLSWVAARIPGFRTIGGGVLLCTLVPPVLVALHSIPHTIVVSLEHWTESYGFIDFYIAALIAGSILGMPRALLISVGARFALPLIGMVIVVLAAVGGIGAALGYGFRNSIFFVAAPILGGGVGAGAVPMSQIYASSLPGSSDTFLTKIIPAVILGNVVCILIAGIYKRLAQSTRPLFQGFSGNGSLLKITGDASDFKLPSRSSEATYSSLSVGLIVASGLFLAGLIVGHYVPAIHPYAWTILFAALLKGFGLVPTMLEDAASDWFNFVAAAWTPALLVGAGVTFLDISALSKLVSDPPFLLLVVLTPILSGTAAGLIGHLVRFYYMESSISIGLGMTDMGGTGDVAVVSAADRFELMPFMQISSRLGGALMLLTVSLLVRIL